MFFVVFGILQAGSNNALMTVFLAVGAAFLMGSSSYPRREREQPEVLGRNGTFVVIRKLHTQVAAFRQYIRDKSSSREEEELLAAKFVGRWPSGARWLSRTSRKTQIWARTRGATTPSSTRPTTQRGLKCPVGAHARRMNPRDTPSSASQACTA